LKEKRIEDELIAAAEDLAERIKELIKEGNARRLTVRHKDRVLLEIPLTAGAVGAFLAPHLAALAIFSGLLTGCTIVIESTKQ